MKSPDFSPFAREYAESRPRYPTELFGHLATLTPWRGLAWDCATGNGQAAVELVKHFGHVIATDVSAEQIRHAAPHPRITYRVAPAEESGIDSGSVDLVTVASALHWFDLEAFYGEVRRVVRPGGVLAAWTYHVGHVEPPFDRVFHHLYYGILFKYFAPGARLVDQRYENIALPGEALPPGDWCVSENWNLHQMLAFIASWSGTQAYRQERGEDPVAQVLTDLEQLWGGWDKVQLVRWPLFIRIARL